MIVFPGCGQQSGEKIRLVAPSIGGASDTRTLDRTSSPNAEGRVRRTGMSLLCAIKYLREAKLRHKLLLRAAATAIVAILTAGAMFGQAAQKTWKDGEYELANPAMSDQNAQTRLGKLDAWKAKFPQTDFEAERNQTYLATYQALKRPADVYATAKNILGKDADNL